MFFTYMVLENKESVRIVDGSRPNDFHMGGNVPIVDFHGDVFPLIPSNVYSRIFILLCNSINDMGQVVNIPIV